VWSRGKRRHAKSEKKSRRGTGGGAAGGAQDKNPGVEPRGQSPSGANKKSDRIGNSDEKTKGWVKNCKTRQFTPDTIHCRKKKKQKAWGRFSEWLRIIRRWKTKGVGRNVLRCYGLFLYAKPTNPGGTFGARSEFFCGVEKLRRDGQKVKQERRKGRTVTSEPCGRKSVGGGGTPKNGSAQSKRRRVLHLLDEPRGWEAQKRPGHPCTKEFPAAGIFGGGSIYEKEIKRKATGARWHLLEQKKVGKTLRRRETSYTSLRCEHWKRSPWAKTTQGKKRLHHAPRPGRKQKKVRTSKSCRRLFDPCGKKERTENKLLRALRQGNPSMSLLIKKKREDKDLSQRQHRSEGGRRKRSRQKLVLHATKGTMPCFRELYAR